MKILEKFRNGYHPPPDLGPETLKVYRDALADVEPDVLRAACLLLVRTLRFWPSIAEIRGACLEVSGERANLPAVGEAYAEARRAAARFGAGGKPVASDFSHAIVHRAAVQASGSWRMWCLSDNEAPQRARFFEVFKELRDREIRQQALPESQRQLTAEKSRQLLEDVNARSIRESLALPAVTDARLPLHKLLKQTPPIPEHAAVVVGEELDDAGWEARKAEILEGA